jgi:hypothetical protein
MNIKRLGQGTEPHRRPVHLEQHGATVRGDLLIGHQSVDGQAVTCQGARNGMDNARIVGATQREISRV